MYGNIISQNLRAKHASVEDMAYNVKEPIDTVFNAVEDLVDLIKLTGTAYSSAQVGI